MHFFIFMYLLQTRYDKARGFLLGNKPEEDIGRYKAMLPKATVFL